MFHQNHISKLRPNRRRCTLTYKKQTQSALYPPNQEKKFENPDWTTSHFLFGNPVLAAKYFETMKQAIRYDLKVDEEEL